MNIADFKARVEAYGGPGVFSRSALSIRDGAGVFERVLGSGAYPRVLEIGTYRGVGTAYIAQFCELVTTIDLNHGKREINGEDFDRHAFWEAMGVSNIALRLVADVQEKAEVIRSIEFDLAFIDAGKHDIAEDFAFVRHCGAVLFHDYDYREGPGDLNSVYDFVNSLPKDQVEVMDIFALWTAKRG